MKTKAVEGCKRRSLTSNHYRVPVPVDVATHPTALPIDAGVPLARSSFPLRGVAAIQALPGRHVHCSILHFSPSRSLSVLPHLL